MAGGEATRASRWIETPEGLRALALFTFVFVCAIAREGPLAYEEPAFFANPGFLFEPWNGALAVFGRASFGIAHLIGDPSVTRLIAAGVIGLVAIYLARVSVPGAISLGLLPIAYPGPYIGPLNSQWFFAIAILVMATEAPRRWHPWALFVAGISGLAPCLMAPVFRDRRAEVLLACGAVQLAILATSGRHPLGLSADPTYLLLAALLLLSLIRSRLPTRTRLVFAYGGLAIIAAAVIAAGTVTGQGRYLTVPMTGIVVGFGSGFRTSRRLSGRDEPETPVVAV